MTKVTYLSPTGLLREQANLQALKEKLAATRILKSEAYTLTGDNWHDNPNWNRLEQDEARAIEEIGALDTMIAKSRIFEAPSVRNTASVVLGSILHVEREEQSTGRTEEVLWEIVPYGDTDLPRGRLGYNAPVAQALMGLEVDDAVDQPGKNGPVTYTIIALYQSWEEAERSAPKLVAAPARPDDAAKSDTNIIPQVR